MNQTMKWLLWSFYSIAMIVFFLYYLFPSDALREYAAAKIKDVNPDLILSIRSMTPAFPIGIDVHGANLLCKDQVWVETDSIRIIPEILSLFGKDKQIGFKGTAWKGSFTGKATLSDADHESSEADISLSGIRAEQIRYIQDMTGKKISAGILSGTIAYHRKKTGGSMESKLSINGLGIADIPILMIKLPVLTFKTADADIVSADMKLIEIRQCAAKGDQATANVSGTVTVNTPFEKSLLNLKADIIPEPALLSSMGKNFPMMGNKKGPISFRIGGSIEQPLLSLN